MLERRRPRRQEPHVGAPPGAAEQGWLRLAFLRLDGRAIAFDMCLEHGGAFYVLKGGFDPEE
ncbi:MAG TPA: GNAT family N-acetyltransferase, partial [Thermoleophilaceae bacterium]|nr:GNAT family N-acetyltransferase [Thermoleophilaceae bacterium]